MSRIITMTYDRSKITFFFHAVLDASKRESVNHSYIFIYLFNTKSYTNDKSKHTSKT